MAKYRRHRRPSSSWTVLARKHARQRRAIAENDRQFEIRAKRVPTSQNLFDDPQIKKILRRRERIVKKS